MEAKGGQVNSEDQADYAQGSRHKEEGRGCEKQSQNIGRRKAAVQIETRQQITALPLLTLFPLLT